MTSMNRYDRLLRDLDVALNSGAEEPTSWGAKANRQSLESLSGRATMAALEHQRRVEARFHRGSVLGNAGPAHQLLRFVLQVNEAVVSTANRLLVKPYAHITDDIRDRLGLLVLPAVAGSFSIELASPPLADKRDRDASTEHEDSQLPGLPAYETVTAQALQLVMDVLETATVSDDSGDLLEQKLRHLGQAGVRHVSRMAAKCEAGDFTVDLTVRSDATRQPEMQIHFKPRDAAWLRSVIKNRDLDVSIRSVEGVLSTASSVRNVFDIVKDDGSRVSGLIHEEARADVVDYFNQRVVAEVEERLDPADPGAETVARRLVRVRLATKGYN